MATKTADRDPRIPPAEECVLPAMLDRQAARLSDKVMIVFDEGPTWTYAETRRLARGTAAALHDLGVKRGEMVLVWLPNGQEIIRLSLGLGYLGAVYAGVNTAVRGGALEHVIAISGASLMIAHADLAPRLEGLDLAKVDRVVIVGGHAEAPAGVEYLPQTAIDPVDREPPPPDPPLEPWDIYALFYTSGTTGPSKGVLVPYLLLYGQATRPMTFFGTDDRFLVNAPYFHAGGALVPFAVLAKGASMVMIPEFSTRTFWDQVRRTGSTCAWSLGAMANFLLKAPERPDDADNPLRVMLQMPLAHDTATFARRFGVEVYTEFDMTELTPVLGAGPISVSEPPKKGFCGRVLPGCEVRIVDEFDCEVPTGEVGELIARSDVPWLITPGYHHDQEATARAWRNGWFHTGDLFCRDGGGNYYFVDRLKDAIRRRGENISSAEVENEVLAHPAVAAAAALAVPSEHGEDEVMVAIEPKPGKTIDPVELIHFLIPRMAHYMVPRYLRVLSALARTETGKIQKTALRAEGVTPDTWDREAAGIEVRRESIGGSGG